MTSPPATPEWQMTPRARRVFLGLIAGAVVLLLSGSAWMTYVNRVRVDPGVRACGSLASRWSALELTEPESRRLRGLFEQSAHTALREHGLAALDSPAVAVSASEMVVRPPAGEVDALRAACGLARGPG